MIVMSIELPNLIPLDVSHVAAIVSNTRLLPSPKYLHISTSSMT